MRLRNKRLFFLWQPLSENFEIYFQNSIETMCAETPEGKDECTEVCFPTFFFGGFITAIIVNPLERKLEKRASVQCVEMGIYEDISWESKRNIEINV